jgi:glycosyltransferase involved in cell wall biosynthesis
MSKPPLLCFSHLRWNFVWQRPQHVMSRLARDRQVFFVEEPIMSEYAGEPPDDAALAVRRSGNVTVCAPVCRDPGLGHGWRLEQMYARLVAELVDERRLAGFTAWFYSPMFLPSIERVRPSLIVYDAMDELSLFKDAPEVLLDRERELLRMADVVFTGGVSLGKAKAQAHQNVHPMPSGVEVEHYQQALDPATPVPDDLERLPRPRIGFFGVIDERIDLALLDEAARLRPQWSFVMLGPVRKIEESDLPRRDNLHYLGQKRYQELPGYVKGFDACTMPFALNDATKFISPTKTLEYMAAHKPIVSTPVADVVGSYAGAVRIAGSAPDFVRAIEAALSETDDERAARIARERDVLAKSSWDAIVARMDQQMAAIRT